MKEFEYITAYWHEPHLKKAFIDFILEIFELDFSEWDEHGYWDDDFMPFSYFKDGKLISSVCLYSLPCIIEGKRSRVAQFSSVGTSPEYRKIGLNKELIERALAWANDTHKIKFLYTSEMAHGFYKKCGFVRFPDNYELIKHSSIVGKKKGLRKIGIDKLDWIYGLVRNREPVSNRFSSLSYKLTMFHLLYKLKQKLYYIEDLDILLAMEVVDQSLVIYDIIGKSIPEYIHVAPYLGYFDIKDIQFRFHTDKLRNPKIELQSLKDSSLYVMDPNSIMRNVVLPNTMQA